MSAADQSRQFKLSFTALALGLREAEAMLALWRDERDWESVGEAAVEGNIFQKSSSASTRRIFREMRQRFDTLDPQTLEQFGDASLEDQKGILLIAVCKCYPFIFDFIRTTLADKLVVFDYRVSEQDFDTYWNQCSIDHPELDGIADSTRKKIRQVTFRLLAEAAVLSSTRAPQITVVHLSSTIENVLLREGLHYRQAFLTI